jgi:hypothetical protein
MDWAVFKSYLALSNQYSILSSMTLFFIGQLLSHKPKI